MKLFPTLPTDLGNRCDNYHISTATTTTGMNEFLRNKQPNEVGPIRRAKGAKSSRQNQHDPSFSHRRLRGFCFSPSRRQILSNLPKYVHDLLRTVFLCLRHRMFLPCLFVSYSLVQNLPGTPD